MQKDFQLRITPKEASNLNDICACLAKANGLNPRDICGARVLRRSIDARQRNIFINLTVRAFIGEPPADVAYQAIDYPDVSSAQSAIVVGAGPAGLFAALRLIELGVKPVVLERGKDVRERKKDIATIPKAQAVDSESNNCFGEGGAGAFSDGKLYTRSKKRGDVDKILRVFCQHGASEDILVDAHPHIGTDKLPRIVENMRLQILKSGGEVHFQTRMDSLIIHNGIVEGVVATDLRNGTQTEFAGPVILATGHSARDVYRYLDASHIAIEAKGIAVGVRLEHPSEMIDRIQYHCHEGRGEYLPAAEYSYTAQVDGRGVYSFCMCPGGIVIPAATGAEQIVVNGMSPSNRGTKWSNSGMVVEVRPEDIGLIMKELECSDDANGEGALAVMHLQEQLERTTWLQGNRRQTAPAQRMADFVNGRLSYDLPDSSYAPGLISSPLHFWLPPFVSKRLQQAFRMFGWRSHGFLSNEALLIAVESRTSSPVRILRDRDNLQHVNLKGLFPCGEGAGYAGGIVSAAIDGERCADALTRTSLENR